MIRDCPLCGGSGRVTLHREDRETTCPDCNGSGYSDFDPNEESDPAAVKEPDSLGGLAGTRGMDR